ncbi:type VI secretion system protein TssA [Comamonas composti]|uniref:type VI secretion system protein TssA n=1 Tax=Comamonas composti TaxID=408558 RepID=UPI0005558142|nr:type VI secretion system ImpA family N-terminal domain-containing protein [Comamonas composti]
MAAKLPPEWSSPLQDDMPCGPYLEYDPDYDQLQIALQPKAEVQYGSFIAPAQGPDWKDVEARSRALLGKSRDIHLLVTLCRCRAHLNRLEGVAEQVGILAGLLELWPNAIHPQRVIDGVSDPLIQANALASIADPQGFAKDLRELVLSSSTALRLSMRDVEQAYAVPRPHDALTPESVRLQLFDLFDQDPARKLALESLCASAAAIEEWSASHLGNDAPSLEVLHKILAPYPQILQEYAQRPSNANGTRSSPHAPGRTILPDVSDVHLPADQEPSFAPQLASPPADLQHLGGPGFSPMPAALMAPAGSIRDQREYVKNVIAQARQWYEENEPSSPVAIMLKQAQRMVGKRYAEVAQMVPLELLQQWDKE